MFRPLLALAFLALSTLPASAETFWFNNVTFEDGATLNGEVNINTYTGQFQSGQFQSISAEFDRGGSSFDITHFDVTNTTSQPVWFGAIGSVPGAELWIALPTSTLVGYAGSEICHLPQPNGCPYFSVFEATLPTGNLYDGAVSGSLGLVPVPTPEPSSMVLAGSGLLSALGMVLHRRRTVA